MITLLQTELEVERDVLSQTKILSDATTEKIFMRNARGITGTFSFNCHLCGVANLVGENVLQTHITGNEHQQRLMFNYTPDAQQFRTPLVMKPELKCPPGEPAPPGQEDYIEKSIIKSPEMKADNYLYGSLDNSVQPFCQTLFDTAKGGVAANLLDSNKIGPVKPAFQNIATLLHDVGSLDKPQPKSLASGEIAHNDDHNIDDAYDPKNAARRQIAKVVSKLLVEQGRSDVSEEDLHNFIQSFIEDNTRVQPRETEEEFFKKQVGTFESIAESSLIKDNDDEVKYKATKRYREDQSRDSEESRLFSRRSRKAPFCQTKKPKLNLFESAREKLNEWWAAKNRAIQSNETFQELSNPIEMMNRQNDQNDDQNIHDDQPR